MRGKMMGKECTDAVEVNCYDLWSVLAHAQSWRYGVMLIVYGLAHCIAYYRIS